MKTHKIKRERRNKTKKWLSKKHKLQDDFYSSINSSWIKKESHANDKNLTMDLFITKKVNHEMKDIVLEKLLQEKTKNGEEIRNIYNASVHWNNDLVENKIHCFIKKLDEYTHKNDNNDRENSDNMYQFLGWFIKQGFSVPIGFDIEIDAKKDKKYITHLTENGLTFSNKETYFSNDKKYRSLRKSYLTFLKTIFSKVFGKGHAYDVKKILAIEKNLAGFLLSYEDLLYIKNTYNAFDNNRCERELDFDWRKFAHCIGFKIPPQTLIIENPKYVKHAIKMLKNWNDSKWNDSDWKNYWVYQIITNASKYHKELYHIYFDFFDKISKVPMKKSIDKKTNALANIENYMNTHISKKYLELYKNEKEIIFVKKLVERFKSVFQTRLENNSWIHADTQKKSLKKLDNMIIVVGCKEKWEPDPELDYSSVDAWENEIIFNKWSLNRDVQLVGKDIPEKNVWIKMEDQNVYDVNAYYNSLENELVLPNALLQPPFVNVDKDMAYNLASIGTTIGHEIIHAFDDDGYYYDENGVYVLNGWWHESDSQKYKEKQAKIVKQYEYAGKLDKLKVDGKLTLTENIADIGGFLLAENVLMDYLNEKQIYAERQDKYLKEFYENYARNWRSNMNISVYKKKVTEDEHSYSKYRVNCVLSNSKNFQRIFGVKPGDKMYFDIEEIW